MNGSSGTNTDRGDADPFSHLHKMSTTAGLGSGDYVAISGTAIAAILLGVGSALVLFNSWVFLVIPLVGVIAAFLAFKQIADSNGTQTGREVAAVGLLLSLGFGGFYGARTLYAAYRNSMDQQQIVSNVQHLGELVKDRKYTDAYAMFDGRFRKKFSFPQFELGWQGVAASPILGGVESMDWNHLLNFETDPVDSTRMASGMILLKGRPIQPLRINMAFRNDGGNWLVDQVPQLFPETPPDTGAGGAGGAGAPKKGSTFVGPQKPTQ